MSSTTIPAFTFSPARVADVALEVTLRAAPAAVWRALTDDIGRWWPAAFYCGAGAGPRRFLLEARPGGRMWEDHGGGDGLVWASVIHVQRGRLLELCGAYAGPLTWVGRFELTASGAGTLVRFSESAIGRLDERTLRGKEQGWRFLLDGCLRAHVEGGAPPAWDGGGC
jgi:uncharacterized protein YndB with AHSA1/START domain